MKIISLAMHNFRKFKDIEINFPEGVIGLIGNNGTGKSTIIEAIGWAIYGNRASRTTKEQIKRQGASKQDDCWVKLTFEMNGNLYEVFRIISGNSADARVKVNGLIAASTSQKVTEFLEKRIGMDYDSFYTSIVAKQQELNALSDKSPAERKKSMLKMLKIDVLEEAIKRVREDRRSREKILDYIERNLKNIDELEKEEKIYQQYLEEHVKKRNKLIEEIRNIEENLKEINEKIKIGKEKAEKYKIFLEKKNLLQERKENKNAILNEKIREKEDLISKKEEYERIKNFVNEFEELNKKKEEIEKLKEKYYERKKLVEKIEEIENELKEIGKEIERLKWELKDEDEIKNINKKLEEEIKYIEEILANLERKFQKNVAERNAIFDKRNEIINELKKIEKLGPQSNCPTCGRLLGEKYEEIVSNFKNEIKKLEEEIYNKEKWVEEIKKEMEKFNNKKREKIEEKEKMEKKLMTYRILNDRLKRIIEKKEEKEKERMEIKERIEKIGEVFIDEEEYKKLVEKLKFLLPIKNKAIILENEIKKLPIIAKNIDELKNEIDLIEKELEKCLIEINLLGFDEERYKELERNYEETKNNFFEKREEIIKMEGKIESIKKDIERIVKEIEEQKKQREKIKDLRKEISYLEMLAGDRDTGLFNKFKSYLISKIGPLLSYYASHFFNVFTNGKYKEIEIDENYDIYIYDRGEKFQLTRFSGGEKDLANLSLRLAISQLIAQKADISLNFIALDEIFGSQDRERRKNVLNALAELKKQFKQIILITHIEDIKDSLEHIIKVYEDEDGISHVKIE